MQIYVDFNNILYNLQGNPLQLYARLFMKGGWLILLLSLIWGFYFSYIYLKKRKYIKTVKYTLFAIDVPKENEKSIKAVEELFNTLHGIISTKTEWEIKMLGRMQLWFGLEIVSIEGYIQFLFRTPSRYNELVKSAIYAQYPDAELTEVEDYMSLIPKDADEPDSKYAGWGMDWYLDKPDYLPLKTYLDFEYSLDKSFIDPMASLLEVMSKLSPGEFIGVMIMIQPTKDRQTDINERAQKEIDELMGKKSNAKETIWDKMTNGIIKGVDKISEGVYELWGDIEEGQEDERLALKMLTPGERAKILAIETKCGKLKYNTRIKTCYVAPKERFSKARGYNGIQGAMKQFDNYNRFKAVKTKAKYFVTRKRKYWKVRRFLRRYTERNFLETKSSILTSDELATLYHFPHRDVMAPLVKKAETKSVEPPTGLPLEEQTKSELFDDAQKKNIQKQIKKGETIDLNLDNKFFESQYAKDQEEKKKFQKKFQKDEQGENNSVPNNLPISPKKSEKKDKNNASQGHLEPPSNLPFVK